MRKTIYECDGCKKLTAKMVIFDAENNLWDRPLYCMECAVSEFQSWMTKALGNGSNVLVVNPRREKV